MQKLLTILLVTLLISLSACTTHQSKGQCPYLKAKEGCSKGCQKSCDKARELKKKNCSCRGGSKGQSGSAAKSCSAQ